MEMKFCQSCGMPLTPEILGTNADGSKNEEYCIYCYKDGAFTGDFNMEQMVEFCSQFVDEFNKNTGKSLTREEYKVELRKYFPTLKRWRLPADQLPHATSPMKQKFIEEVNALGIKDMPKIDNLFVLQGSFINQEYKINGHSVKLLDDNASYWGNQVEKLGSEVDLRVSSFPISLRKRGVCEKNRYAYLGPELGSVPAEGHGL